MEVTVEEFMKIPLIDGSRIVAGASGKCHTVRSLCFMDSINGWQYLDRNMLAVTSGYVLSTAGAGISELITQMCKQGISGVTVKRKFFSDEIYSQMLETADRLGFPVIELEDNGMPFSKVFNYYNAHVYSRRLQEYLRTDAVSGMLIGAINTNGLSGLAKKCCELTGRPTAVVLRRTLLCYPEKQESSNLVQFLSELGFLKSCTEIDADNKILQLKSGRAAAKGCIFNYSMSESGTIWFDEESSECDENEVSVLGLAQKACEISTRQIAAYEQDEDELRRDFTEKLLTGIHQSYSESLIMARRLKWRLPAQLMVLLIKADLDRSRYKQAENLLQMYFGKKEMNALACYYSNMLALMLPGDFENKGELLNDIKDLLTHRWPEGQFEFALGRVLDLRDACISYQQARLAMRTGMQKKNRNGIVTFDDIGLYRICGDGMPDELKALCRELISPLEEGNRKYNFDLIETLRIFFQCGSNYTTAGQKLHIHANTVRYRLSVAEKLCGIDLGNYDDTMKMQVALMMMPVLFPNI